MILGGPGGVGRVSGPRVSFRELGPDLGPNAGLVELFLVLEKTLFFFFGFLLVEALPLPLVEAAGESAGTATHASVGGGGGSG